jgi:transposase
MTISRAEVITSKERRRRWWLEEKRQLVAASLEPGASMAARGWMRGGFLSIVRTLVVAS